MRIPADIPKGLFYTLREGWVLLNRDMERGAEVVIGPDLPIRCMFKIRNLLLDGVRIGFIFTSAFDVTNRGGFLFTHLKGKPSPTEYDTLIKDESLVVYDYPNRGTIAISPMVSDDVETVFQEQ